RRLAHFPVAPPERVVLHLRIPAIRSHRIDLRRAAVHVRGVVAANAGGEGEQLAELDLGLAWIAQRECIGRKVCWGENLLIEPIGKQLWPLRHQHADRDARETLAARGEVRRRVAMAESEVAFVDEPT